MTEDQRTKEPKNMQQENDKYVVISTKVSPDTAEQLNAICDAMKVDTYHIFQWFVQVLVRMASPDHQLTPDIQKLMAIMENDAGWQEAFNMCAPNGKLDIAQMILILQQKDKKGFGAVMIDKPFLNEAVQTENVDSIVERAIEVCMKGVYRRLRMLAVDMDCNSISELLITMTDAQQIQNLDRENAEQMQGPNNFHEYGRQIAYGKKTKSIHRKGIDMFDRQTTIKFTDDDRKAAEHEADGKDLADELEETEGFRPHGIEW